MKFFICINLGGKEKELFCVGHYRSVSKHEQMKFLKFFENHLCTAASLVVVEMSRGL